MPSEQDRVELLGVVVPAHDEEERVAACLASVVASVSATPGLTSARTVVVLVADSCADRTAERGAHLADIVVEISERNVGRGRATGMRAVLAEAEGLPLDQVWLATTDADSVVPVDWLTRQLELRHLGAQAVAGTVRVGDWEEQPEATRSLHRSHYRAAGGHRFGHQHVHGANLACSGLAYELSGGFAAGETAEDRDLWRRLRATGLPVVSSPLSPVRTSGRRDGRAPHGFAGFLRALASPEPTPGTIRSTGSSPHPREERHERSQRLEHQDHRGVPDQRRPRRRPV